MRKSNWKSKVLIFIAFIIGVVAAVVVATVLPDKFEMYKGLLSFGTLALVSTLTVFIGVKIFRIGED